MTIHFRRIDDNDLALLEGDLRPWWWKARYYRDGQQYGAAFRCPTDGSEDDAAFAELQAKANEVGVAVQFLRYPHGLWVDIPPRPVRRYAFVVRCWPDGREPELATRNGRLIVSTDKTVLCPPYEAVVFSGDPAWTVPVADEPVLERPPADDSSASDGTEQDNPKESP